MSTIKDIAKYTGLSVGVISKYLNGGNVLPENKELISRAVKKLDYNANRMARGLKTNKTMNVAVLLPTLASPFFARVSASLDKELRSHGYSCFVSSYDFDAALELEKLRFAANNADGVVLVPEHITTAQVLSVSKIASGKTPVLLLDRTISDLPFDFVGSDNVQATRDAVTHFTKKGHSRIGLIAGPSGISTAAGRRRGYELALGDADIPIEDELIRVGDYDIASGYRAFRELAELPHPPTAICVTNYDMTLGAISAANDLHIALPTDIDFIGFDNIELCRVVSPPLPMIEQAMDTLGESAARLLLRRLRGDIDDMPHEIRIPANLLIL